MTRQFQINYPGGTPGNSWCGYTAWFSKSWPYFRPKNVKTWSLKFIPVFRPEITSIQERQQKDQAENPFRICAYRLSFLIIWNWNNNYVYTFVVPSKTILDSRPRLDFRRLPGPVFDPPILQGRWVRAHFPEQRLVIEPIPDQNAQDLYPFSDRKGAQKYPLGQHIPMWLT